MRKLFLAGCVMVLLAGCGDRAKDICETARFEEKQFNKPHAAKLYRQIIEQYPDSPYASQAKAWFGRVGKTLVEENEDAIEPPAGRA